MTTQALEPTLSEPGEVTLVTRAGLALHMRPVTPGDAGIVEAFFGRLSPDDMRFRFLTAARLSGPQVAAMVGVDHRHAEHLLAFAGGSAKLVASMMIVADDAMESAEVAIAVDPQFKDHGIGWTLLHHAATLARERGLRRLRSIESRGNHQAIEVERALGFSVKEYEGDSTLALVEAEFH